MVIFGRNKCGVNIFSFMYNKILLWHLFSIRCGLFLLPSSEKILFEISPPILNFIRDQGSKEFKHYHGGYIDHAS